MSTRFRRAATLVLLLSAWPGHAPGQAPAPAPPAAAASDALPEPERIRAVRAYIRKAWTTLSRSTGDLPAAARDPKLRLPRGSRWPVYVPAAEDRAKLAARLRAELGETAFATIDLRPLPKQTLELREHGLLYLPHPYVVPGGRFNEMYGWDSYFILLGLLRDEQVLAARQMVENFLYEIRHYGTVLNANRSYYLSRSQPSFLTRMILVVFEKTRDRVWLEAALLAAEQDHGFWTREPHLVPATGLSRYYDFGEGPAPEVLSDEKDAQGRTHYDRVREYYRTHDVTDYEEARFYDAAADVLLPLFYKGDRSMRESGFDPSNRFGPFSADITSHLPVCLNSLLYQMERDLAQMRRLIGDLAAAARFEALAEERRARMDRYLWDEAQGLYLDYNFETEKRRAYPFATTFYPLWAGAASPAQAARVAKNLRLFEEAHGLLTSTTTSGSQWDAPFGWAPLQLIAVGGLRRTGHELDAERLARKFIALVTRDFERSGTIVEKYDVRRGDSDVAGDIRFGYIENQLGFGWTNGAYLEMLYHVSHGDSPGSQYELPKSLPGHPGGAAGRAALEGARSRAR
jgi:alpha,alpha-trehalase